MQLEKIDTVRITLEHSLTQEYNFILYLGSLKRSKKSEKIQTH